MEEASSAGLSAKARPKRRRHLDDAKFDIDPTAGSVTQTATANISNATEKFFKAAIEVDVSNNEDP
ncbi:MAG: hypothetical protein IKD78_02300 [Bacteroidales bacterium]|nr:hypothetical protein [Bacteroidales bacterium]